MLFHVGRAPDWRRIELRGPASESAFRAVLKSSPTADSAHPGTALPRAVGSVAGDPRLRPIPTPTGAIKSSPADSNASPQHLKNMPGKPPDRSIAILTFLTEFSL